MTTQYNMVGACARRGLFTLWQLGSKEKGREEEMEGGREQETEKGKGKSKIPISTSRHTSNDLPSSQQAPPPKGSSTF
jgi:hypothetical protein